jgi:hypothetical protein
MKPVLLFASTWIVLSSCNQHHRLDDSQRKSVENEVKEMLTNYHADVKSGGLAAEFKYLDESDDFFWVPPGFHEPLNYDSISSILNRMAPALSSIHNEFETLKVIPLSDQIATYTARVRSVVTDTAGVTTTTRLHETGVVIKRKDGWRLLNGQTTALP